MRLFSTDVAFFTTNREDMTVLLAVLSPFTSLRREEAWVVGLFRNFFLSFRFRSILFLPNFLFSTINCEKISTAQTSSSPVFSAATAILPMLSPVSLIRACRWKDGSIKIVFIASSSLTEKFVDNNSRVVGLVQIMVAA